MRIIEKITKASVYGSAVAMGLVFILVSVNIFARAFGHSIFGLDEFIGYIMPWVIFLSVPLGIRSGSQIDIDLLFNLLPSRIQKPILVVMYILSAIALAFMARAGYLIVYHSFKSNWVTVQLMFKIWPWQLCMPFGFGIMAIESLDYAIRLQKGVVTKK